MQEFLDCIASSWTIRIGDPTPLGWMTAALYALAAALCFAILARRAFHSPYPRREAAFWLIAGLLLTALALNKELDLQSVLTSTGRCIARHQGWYRERRFFQYDFILALGAATAACLVAAAFTLRGTLRYTALPLLGVVFVMGFVLVRAVSLHHVDRLLSFTVATERLRWLLELPGPLIVAVSALWLLARSRR